MSELDPFKVPGDIVRALGESAEKFRAAPVRTELSAGQKLFLYLTTLAVVAGFYLSTPALEIVLRLPPRSLADHRMACRLQHRDRVSFGGVHRLPDLPHGPSGNLPELRAVVPRPRTD